MHSTLRPGKVPPAIAALRDAASDEIGKPVRGTYTVRRLKFDKEMIGMNTPGSFDQDDNTLARFSGLVSPHVGNGKGAPK